MVVVLPVSRRVLESAHVWEALQAKQRWNLILGLKQLCNNVAAAERGGRKRRIVQRDSDREREENIDGEGIRQKREVVI